MPPLKIGYPRCAIYNMYGVLTWMSSLIEYVTKYHSMGQWLLDTVNHPNDMSPASGPSIRPPNIRRARASWDDKVCSHCYIEVLKHVQRLCFHHMVIIGCGTPHQLPRLIFIQQLCSNSIAYEVFHTTSPLSSTLKSSYFSMPEQ
jgi:hypothetical protein